MSSVIRTIGAHIESDDFTAQYAHERFASSFRFHSHSAYEFYVLLKGNVKICLEDMICDIQPNTLFIFPPNSLHGLLSNDILNEYKRIYFHIKPRHLEKISYNQYNLLQAVERSINEMRLIYKLEDDQISRLIRNIEQIEQLKQSSKAPINQLKRNALLTDCALILVEAIELQRDFGSTVMSLSYHFVSDALRYIDENFQSPLTLESIASNVNVSKFHLSHEFKRLINSSVIRYVINKRLHHALSLLNQNVSVQDACFQSGFLTYSNFLNAFRAYYGVSPREYHKLDSSLLPPIVVPKK